MGAQLAQFRRDPYLRGHSDYPNIGEVPTRARENSGCFHQYYILRATLGEPENCSPQRNRKGGELTVGTGGSLLRAPLAH